MAQGYTSAPAALPVIASIAVAVGLGAMPYGYYMLLRLFLCGASLFYMATLMNLADAHKWTLGGLAVLYNPIVPVHLGDKTLWALINVATVGYFWFIHFRAHRS